MWRPGRPWSSNTKKTKQPRRSILSTGLPRPADPWRVYPFLAPLYTDRPELWNEDVLPLADALYPTVGFYPPTPELDDNMYGEETRTASRFFSSTQPLVAASDTRITYPSAVC